jgi:hypothetical protein
MRLLDSEALNTWLGGCLCATEPESFERLNKIARSALGNQQVTFEESEN